MAKYCSLPPGVDGRLLALGMCLLLAGCGDPIGTSCRFQGSGFTASDNCRHRCLEHRRIVCPDGRAIRPQICSGRRQCAPGSCPGGQVCYHVDAPFELESYCVPADICGSQPAGVLKRWEQASLATSRETLAEWQVKKQQRGQLTPTAPAQALPVDPKPETR